jgi:hypothetical protein
LAHPAVSFRAPDSSDDEASRPSPDPSAPRCFPSRRAIDPQRVVAVHASPGRGRRAGGEARGGAGGRGGLAGVLAPRRSGRAGGVAPRDPGAPPGQAPAARRPRPRGEWHRHHARWAGDGDGAHVLVRPGGADHFRRAGGRAHARLRGCTDLRSGAARPARVALLLPRAGCALRIGAGRRARHGGVLRPHAPAAHVSPGAVPRPGTRRHPARLAPRRRPQPRRAGRSLLSRARGGAAPRGEVVRGDGRGGPGVRAHRLGRPTHADPRHPRQSGWRRELHVSRDAPGA